MKIQIIVAFCLAIIFSSCHGISRKIVYTFNNVSIIRLDSDGESLFYYGDQTTNIDGQVPIMKSRWGQRDGGFDAFLIFHQDKSVEVVRLFGWIDVIQKSVDLYLSPTLDDSSRGYDVIFANKWCRSIEGRYNNVTYISASSIQNEIERNRRNFTKVKAAYY